jgi:hypothetical protein
MSPSEEKIYQDNYGKFYYPDDYQCVESYKSRLIVWIMLIVFLILILKPVKNKEDELSNNSTTTEETRTIVSNSFGNEIKGK